MTVARDLFILIAWAGLLTGIMLIAFYTRTCRSENLPCQSYSDFAMYFAIAAGAGLAIRDERVLVIGFLVVHFLTTFFFLASLTAPAILGLTEPFLSDNLTNLSVIIVFRGQFPVPILTSFTGSITGWVIGGKLRLYD